MLEMGITFDFGQLVMDNEFAGMIKHAVQGIPINDETLSVDVIHEVGIFSDFLCHKSTFQNMRQNSQANLIDRKTRTTWEEAGSTDIYQRSVEEARNLLETHKPLPLEENISQSIREIIDSAEDELGVKSKFHA